MFRSRQPKVDDIQLSARIVNPSQKPLIVEKKIQPSSFNINNVSPSSDESSIEKNNIQMGTFQTKRRSNQNSLKNNKPEKTAAKKIRITINNKNSESFKESKLKKNPSNFSLGNKNIQGTSEKIKKRETRIKSLYATTTNT